MTVTDFYDRLAPFYHLIYPEWETSIHRQAAALDGIIKARWGQNVQTVLDVACGIGTQTLGLATRGYTVTASDLSPVEVARAKHEAAARSLPISFSVADMRYAYAHHQQQFDLVIACDNSVPHLLTDAELLQAFQQFYAFTRPGGGCLIAVRDYAVEQHEGLQVKPYGIRVAGQTRYLVFQVWEFRGDRYDLAMYFVEDHGATEAVTHIMRTQYYVVGIDTLISLLQQAGFQDVQRLDESFFQPIIVGTRS